MTLIDADDSAAPSSATLDLADGVPGVTPVVPGHVSIAPRVLQKVGSAIVAERLTVDHRDVRVEARDDEGRLALRVATPLSIPVLSEFVDVPAGGVIGTIRSLQETVSRRLNEITGRAVSRVDVTVTGSHIEKTGALR